ncbi:hypothetical protein KGY79_09175 [Candidatus Bipolaricaulota bacterium]|nr:hypothetical protein [Candidatus Bipolaricaulota bacterium]
MIDIFHEMTKKFKPITRVGFTVIVFLLIVFLANNYYSYGDSTITSDTISIYDFSGTKYVYHEGFGGSNQTVITDSNWAFDEITVTGSPGSRTVLDQFIKADSTQTKITRNALFIGSGSINTESIYKGSNTSNGEDNRTGILILGDNYGVLIGNCCSIFNESFGGIKNSLATASGNYLIQLIGDLGSYSAQDFSIGETSTLLQVTGTNSATLETLLYGSSPQSGTDPFYESTKGCATGTGSFLFSGSSGQSSVEVLFGIFEGWGDYSTELIFDYLEVFSQFKFEDYGQFLGG